MTRRVDLIGMPTDVHSSFLRGCAQAPPLIRAALFSPHGNEASERGLELGAEIALHDRGDLALTEAPSDDALIEAAIEQSLLRGAIPIALGGDHSITYPILRAIAAHHGPVDILHFDAHPDLYDELGGDRRSHASPFARIMEEGLASRLVQVGIRTLNKHQREQAARTATLLRERFAPVRIVSSPFARARQTADAGDQEPVAIGVLTDQPTAFGSQIWIGGVLELTCGLAIAIGFFASLAAFIASGMMAVAYFQYHWNFAFDSTFFPIVNHGELAVVYCFLFLYIACRGSGMWSAEAKQRRD